ncbi:hypothetical protein SUGI_0767830 [Cryptomeria japonica]|nr:hypothetical protein SUGI_0767830 [Cryptomeria japonica]
MIAMAKFLPLAAPSSISNKEHVAHASSVGFSARASNLASGGCGPAPMGSPAPASSRGASSQAYVMASGECGPTPMGSLTSHDASRESKGQKCHREFYSRMRMKRILTEEQGWFFYLALAENNN